MFLPLLIPLALAAYFLSSFILLVVRQARSPLRHLPGPPSPSFFVGHLREMHDQENNGLVARWTSAYGSTFVYRGFLCGRRLMTTDPRAVNHIMSRGYDYPKPDFVRDSLASMAAGYEGLLTAEGEMHRKQRKILNPAFSAPQIKSLTPIFWEKAVKLRDIWLDIVASQQSFTPADPLTPQEPSKEAHKADPEPATTPVLSPSAISTSFLPNPFASFVPSKASPSVTSTFRSRRAPSSSSTSASPSDEPSTAAAASACSRIDVLPWLARATLDVIGEAGFGYHFRALDAAAERRESESESELARAFGVIFGTARKFRVMTVLQVWFPVLRYFKTENAAMRQATASTRKIGTELIEQRRAAIAAENPSEKEGAIEGDKTTLDRDLLSVLIRSNISEIPSQRMSVNEILCQISTFLAAGHETSSSALTWMLYALAREPRIQTKLRAELRTLALPPPFSSPSRLPSSPLPIPHLGAESPASPCSPMSLPSPFSPSSPTSPSSPSSPSAASPTSPLPPRAPTPSPSLLSQIAHLPYLDAVVREALRLYAPVTTTMRVATADDAIPLAAPFVDARGRTCATIRVARGDIISVPIQAMNAARAQWGEDAGVFRPERWLGQGEGEGVGEDGEGKGEEGEGSGEKRRGVSGLWGKMLTFGGGNPVNGNRSCIGYRFALSEIKIFLFVLLRDLEFCADPAVEIEKKVNVVTRPCVKSEPHRGNQMPLYVRCAPCASEAEAGADA